MEQKSQDLSKKKDDSTSDGSSQKITNYFPVLRTEGRAKMCAGKTDDSKQKEMLKKLRGSDNMNLRSKRNEKSGNNESPGQLKEKLRNVPVATALKTPLSQVSRKSIEEKRSVGRPPKSTEKINVDFIKKEIPDNEVGRVLRNKVPLPTKPQRRNSYKRKAEDTNEKTKSSASDSIKTRTTTKISTQGLDSLLEGSRSVEYDASEKLKKPIRRRHFRGGTYGLYLTPAKKKKMKLKSSEKIKDDECSVTSTENNSFLDSEDANSLVSEDFCTPSDKSLVDEQHRSEDQSLATTLTTEIKHEKQDCDTVSETPREEIESAPVPISSIEGSKSNNSVDKMEINADYEENTQNVIDLFDDLEEIQWEANKKGNENGGKNQSEIDNTPMYDDISNESVSNALHFSIKEISSKVTDDGNKDDATPYETSTEPPPLVDTNNNDDSPQEVAQRVEVTGPSSDIQADVADVCTTNQDSNMPCFSEVNSKNNNFDLISRTTTSESADLKKSTVVPKNQEETLIVEENNKVSSSDVDKDYMLCLDRETSPKTTNLQENKEIQNCFADVSESIEDICSNNYINEKTEGKNHLTLGLPQDSKFKIDSVLCAKGKEVLNETSSKIITKISPEVLDESPPAVLDETTPEAFDETPPEVLGDTLPEVLGDTPPEVLDDTPPEVLDDTPPEVLDDTPAELLDESKDSSSLMESDSLAENKDDSSLPDDDPDAKDTDSEEMDNESENKDSENQFESNMEIDNSEKQDEASDSYESDEDYEDEDGASTIANCVKSRQRIKRKFTDDIVDTDLGILSVAAMENVKKSGGKLNEPQHPVESIRPVTTKSEVKKGHTVAKIRCVFDYSHPPIKQCGCEGDPYNAKLNKNEENAFCQAVDSIDDKLLGCSNPVVTYHLVRPSVKIPFTLMCEMHLWRLKHHHACPYCGLFCSQGSFIQCKGENGTKTVHLYHEHCQPKEDAFGSFCLHCGSASNIKRVYLEMHMASPPSFFLSQNAETSVPISSRARISFSEHSDVSKKDDEDPNQIFKIEDSGKVLSSAGLPDGANKEELEKLLSVLSEDKVKSTDVTSDEFYDLASSGDVLKVLHMLANGLDPNTTFPSHDNETAMHAASANGHITVVHLLIQAGAVYDCLNDRMYTPLMLAVENGHKDVVHYLVKKGAQTDFKGETGMSSVHLAAKGGNLEVLKILMSSRDSDINSQDDGGWTPIVWASEHGHLNVVRYLLKRGANPNIRDNEGNIGLHWSAFSGSVEISYLYLDYGCDINAVNELGDTPLHIAARQDSFPCVTLFLSRGANVQLLNKAGKLPAECCIDKNSDTYLSLSLNMLVKKITGKYQHKAEKIIHRDISRGKEQLAIQCVNAYDDEMPPVDFLYVTENCETMPIKIDRTITSLQACHCEDDCSTSNCSCASISYQCWYDKEGLLLPEFNLLDPPMLFECNRACSCWSLNCHNRVLQNGISSRLQLIRTQGKGWGVRTLKDIPRGAFICEYVGELISDSAADKRSDDSYLFDLDNRDGETYCLDARYYGNISRFINHLCEPNLVPVKVYVDHQDLNFPRIAFFSSRDIKQYEELGFDYGEKFWVIKYKYFTCECGVPKCKYSKDSIHVTLANYYRRLKEEQMEEAAATAAFQQQQHLHNQQQEQQQQLHQQQQQLHQQQQQQQQQLLHQQQQQQLHQQQQQLPIIEQVE